MAIIRASDFDVGETLVDEMRRGGEWLAVPLFNFFGMWRPQPTCVWDVCKPCPQPSLP